MLMETFTRVGLRLGGIRGVRIASIVAVLMLAFTSWSVVRRLSPERKLLLFDLGIAFVLAVAFDTAARRLITLEARGQRRRLAAVVVGIVAAAAAQGAFAVSFCGEAVGASRLPALVTAQLTGALLGAVLGFFTAFVGLVVVLPLRAVLPTESPRLDGLLIGTIAGFLGGLSVAAVPDLGSWFVIVSTIVCGGAGYRAALRFEQALCVGRRDPRPADRG